MNLDQHKYTTTKKFLKILQTIKNALPSTKERTAVVWMIWGTLWHTFIVFLFKDVQASNTILYTPTRARSRFRL